MPSAVRIIVLCRPHRSARLSLTLHCVRHGSTAEGCEYSEYPTDMYVLTVPHVSSQSAKSTCGTAAKDKGHRRRHESAINAAADDSR